MRISVFAYVVIATLTGCDAAINSISELSAAHDPTIIIPSGYRMKIDGHTAFVQGYDTCPKQGTSMGKLFGQTTDEDSTTCIILTKGRTFVPVLIALPTGTFREDWAIIREIGKTDGGRIYSKTSLRRPNGTFVMPSNDTLSAMNGGDFRRAG